MPPQGLTLLVLRDFSGGWVTHRPASLLRSNEASIAENVEVHEGVIKRRDGVTKIHTLPLPSPAGAPVTGLFPFYFQTTKQLLATAGSYLMKSTGGDFTTIASVFVPSTPARPTFTSLQDAVYIATEYGAQLVQVVKKWDGTTLTTPPGAPVGSLITTFSNALWVGGDTGAPSRIRFSGQAGQSPNQDSWPALNFIDIVPGDGDKIVGLGHTLNELIVFKERSIHKIIGEQPIDAATDTGNLTVINLYDQPGCVAPRTVSSIQDRVAYLGRDGVYVYDGVKVIETTENIRDFFETQLDVTELRNSVGAWVSPNHYLLAVTTAALEDVVISIHLHDGRPIITLWKAANALINSINRFQFTADGEKAVFGGNGEVYKYSGNTDAGQAIIWKYQTGALDMGFPQYLKLLRKGQLRADIDTGQSFTFQALKNFTTSGPSKSILLDATSTEDIGTYRIVMGGVAKAWEFSINGSGFGNPPKIHEISFEYVLRRI